MLQLHHTNERKRTNVNNNVIVEDDSVQTILKVSYCWNLSSHVIQLMGNKKVDM